MQKNCKCEIITSFGYITFFSSKVFCYIFVYNLLFCCFQFFRKHVPQLYRHIYPQGHWSIELTIASNGSQLLLSNSLFRLKSKNEFV